ncbi:MAG TPA: hypothetical protein VJV05_04500 [Pyrinomonadaceae bacterium]|nr:hypothetical protein [Pyrinomonadaceae bacterium]
MRILFYVLAAAAGLLGLLALFRTVEQVLAGNGLQAAQFVVGIVGIVLATLWIKRARAAGN